MASPKSSSKSFSKPQRPDGVRFGRGRVRAGRPDPRMKQCPFCEHGTLYIDYKDYPVIKPYVDYFGNIRKRYYTGVCLKHQKMLKTAVERARFMAMLSYRK